jgi:hypothetical protein
MEPLDEETVEQLERVAELPLGERRALVAAQLRGLIEAANELSRKMAAPHLQGLVPSVGFRHPGGGEEGRP